MKKPYLLAPCGSPEALRAAISAGADECYFGGSGKNARMNAKGFSEDEFFDALRLLKLHGKRSNVTLNTLLFDRELCETVEFAKKAHSFGADAFIVQDLGLASILSKEIPGVELHASTQCACHSLDGAIQLSKLGFSRIVLARELPLSDIISITEYGRKSGEFETEVFVHGALCVCHSGMCLMSSVIGDRSGNRGLCAQPCRMPGSLESCNGSRRDGTYPLSLRDLSLSKHITKLLPVGIASLKIEGRMKSPEYVYRTTKILRELIDTCSDADDKKYGELLDIFSRGGFTDGYFTGRYLTDNRKMYGYRSEADKGKTAEAQVTIPDVQKIPVSLEVSVRDGEMPFAKFTARGKSGEFTLPNIPGKAQNAPLSKESLLKNMSKLGATQFVLGECKITLDDGLFLAASEINALRRGAVEALENALLSVRSERSIKRSEPTVSVKPQSRKSSVQKIRIITDNPLFEFDGNKYSEELESICLPLELFRENKPFTVKHRFGVRLPRVIFQAERENVILALKNAVKCGAEYVYVSNIGQLEIARTTGLPIYGGMGLNVTNSETFLEYARMGLECITLSPELNTSQMRDIMRAENVRSAAVVKGRLPLMVLESCILRANGLCTNYDGKCRICGEYTDRIGKKFPIYPERRFGNKGEGCRNVILNADVLDLYRKRDEIRKSGVEILEIIAE